MSTYSRCLPKRRKKEPLDPNRGLPDCAFASGLACDPTVPAEDIPDKTDVVPDGVLTDVFDPVENAESMWEEPRISAQCCSRV